MTLTAIHVKIQTITSVESGMLIGDLEMKSQSYPVPDTRSLLKDIVMAAYR
jgi:hypothetical protein